MSEEKAGDWRSKTTEGKGETISSRSSAKGTEASRSGTGGGGRVGVRREEMASRLPSARTLWANPCSIFPRYRNLDAREKTTLNIVNCRVECLSVESAKVYTCISDKEKKRDGEARYMPIVDY